MPTAAPENVTASYLPLPKNGGFASLRPDVQAFVNQADAFLADETNWDADCLRPTPRALQALFHLLTNVEAVLPKGSLYPDGDGGLRLEWRVGMDKEKYLLLAVHASEESRDYLYHQTGSGRGEIKNSVSVALLTRHLQTLHAPK